MVALMLLAVIMFLRDRDMSLSLSIEESFFVADEEMSFERIVTTAKGSRVMRPHFGSDLYKLVDKSVDGEFMMLFNRYLLEAFFDENEKPWDERLTPLSVKIQEIESTKGSLRCMVTFENSEVAIEMGGF